MEQTKEVKITLPSRRVLLLPERVVRVNQNITMQGGTINWGGSIEERIREIVREEIAAHEERLKERLTLDGEKIAEALGEHLRKRREATGETWLDDIP